MLCFEKLEKTRWKVILFALFIATLSLRLLLYWLLEAFNPAYIANVGSVLDDYLIPRLRVLPWTVDWSYGPLTYLIYASIDQTSFSSLLARAINFTADAASTYYVAVVASKFLTKKRAILAAACWAFATPVLWESVIGGTDSLPILSTLAAADYALVKRFKGSALLIGVGFALKWYPILLLPLMLRPHLTRRNSQTLVLLSIFPFLLVGGLTFVDSLFSGVTFTDILAITIHNFASRIPAGPSIWNLLRAVVLADPITSRILIFASYTLLLGILLWIGIRSPVESGFYLLSSSTLLLLGVVTAASQIQGNYLLWYYPLILILIFIERNRVLLFSKLTLLAAVFVFNELFIYPRLSIIAQGPTALAATVTPYDILSVLGFQMAAWALFYMLYSRLSQRKIESSSISDVTQDDRKGTP